MSSAGAEARLKDARAAHARGDVVTALRGYEELLGEEPGRADVWHLKALAHFRAGDAALAWSSVQRALALDASNPVYLMLEGELLRGRGDLEGACERFARAAAARPDWAPAHLARGEAELDLGRNDAAAAAFEAATRADPRHVRAWNNLGVARLAAGRADAAVEAFARAAALDPRYALAQYNLARAHRARGDSARALEHVQAALGIDARAVDAWLLAGNLHRRRSEPAQALAAYEGALRAAPAHTGARLAHAEMLAEVGAHDDAHRDLARLEADAPDDLRVALHANLLLPRVYPSAEDLDEARARYTAGLERLHERAARFDLGGPDHALEAMSWTNFFLAYQGRDDRALQGRYGEFQRRMLEPVLPRYFEPPAPRAARERVRVGFFSHFFFNCTVGRYFRSWVTDIDRRYFEVYVYYTNDWMANDTREIAASAQVFRHLAGQPLHRMAAQVAADELDVLVYPELGMHADTFTLAGLRLAPVQCCGWGHPTTPGLAAIDWFVSCAEMEPPEAQRHYAERLALLPGLGTRYAVPRAVEPVTRADLGIPGDVTAYLVPQSLFKIHPDNDALIAEVLAAHPRSVAVMFASTHERVTDAFARRLERAFAPRGLDLQQRVVFLAPNLPHARYLGVNAVCDAMLDTLHWSGGNTSLDALAAGLPVVTLPGALMRGRQSAAMLTALGVPELVASDTSGYVDVAARLGRDREMRQALSHRIIANAEALFDRAEPVAALERFLLSAAGR